MTVMVQTAARICIVGGYQRSGTRNFADLCEAHPDVRLFGEVGRYAFPLVNKRLNALNEYHVATREGGSERLDKRKHVIALGLLAMHAKRPQIGFNEDDFKTLTVGFKTPRAEWQWRRFIEMFSTLSDSKVFFYSCRTAEDIYLSTVSLGWKKNIAGFTKYLKRSLSSVLEFEEASRESDGGWIVRPLHLNAYIESADKGQWLVDNLFRYIAPALSAEQAADYASRTSNRNATVKATGQERRMDLTADECSEFEADTELHELIARLNDTFGLQVRIFSDRAHRNQTAV